MKNFTLKCKFCGNDNQEEFQTTLEDWDGYSEYTVLNSGYAEFKCLKCGTFGTTDSEEGDNNKLNMFEVTCNQCGSTKWEFYSSLDNEDGPYIKCDECGVKE
jgi:DNA-directed RNA polymerase subunit RPC12/RpoP